MLLFNILDLYHTFCVCPAFLSFVVFGSSCSSSAPGDVNDLRRGNQKEESMKLESLMVDDDTERKVSSR